MHEIACEDVVQATPDKQDSHLEALFGPGMGFSESYVVFAAEPMVKVASVEYAGKRVPWAFVRRLNPQTTGRDVYYVALPDSHNGWIDVTLEQPDGKTIPDRLPVTMGTRS
ncbi:hypothetical protein ACFXDJ_00120 [Streptomyces sp. NPDC059443]|uniref:hypothetical protein n=1 Tax=unclassified Streptomyces TaxID=2593676 RepID=UPI00367A9EF6